MVIIPANWYLFIPFSYIMCRFFSAFGDKLSLYHWAALPCPRYLPFYRFWLKVCPIFSWSIRFGHYVSYTLPYIVTKIFVSLWGRLACTLSKFQVCDRVLLTIVTMLYVTMACFITRSWYRWTPFHLCVLLPKPHLWQPPYLFSIAISLVFFPVVIVHYF